MEITRSDPQGILASTMAALARCNEKTGRYGLRLSQQEMMELVRRREEVLEQTRRVEFGGGVLEKLIEAFQDSPYLHQGSYAETIDRLQEIFYLSKNECQDHLTDASLLHAMRRIFDGPAGGSLEYLEGTGLEALCRWARDPQSWGAEEKENEQEEEDG